MIHFMNKNKIFGSNRDKTIVETIERLKCLDGDQIELLFFRNTCNLESAKRQSQNRLKIIVEKKKLLHRWRMNLDEPYKYFIADFAQKEHITLLNWMLINVIVNMKYDKIYHLQYQKDYGILIPDLFLVTKNYVTNEYKATFFEMDNSITNKFDKVQKYNRLFESKPNDEYVNLTAPNFPKIIIATTDSNRLKEINRLIETENKNNLRFETHLIWDLKERCKGEKIESFRNKFIYDSNPIQISLC